MWYLEYSLCYAQSLMNDFASCLMKLDGAMSSDAVGQRLVRLSLPN